MLDLGIAFVSVALVCPGARRMVSVHFRDGSIGFMNLDGTCAIVALAKRGNSIATALAGLDGDVRGDGFRGGGGAGGGYQAVHLGVADAESLQGGDHCVWCYLTRL